jgi:hypothetical protein
MAESEGQQKCDYWTDTVQGLTVTRWYCISPAGHTGYHDMITAEPKDTDTLASRAFGTVRLRKVASE